MTREDIIRMAREAGVNLPSGPFPSAGSFTLPELLHFAALVAAAEREECAKVCDEAHELMNSSFQGAAAAIRARENV